MNNNKPEISGEFSNLIQESSEMDVEVNSSNSLSNDLAKWFMSYNIPHRAASSLLKLLKNNGHNELPGDVRTLLSTPKNTYSQIIEEGGGTSAYFGLANGLIRSIERFHKSAPKSIKIDINVDGLPIAKSSGSQFWPILCSLVSSDFISEPFIIKIFHGLKKPENVNLFLQTFIEEASVILEHGIIFNNKPVQVTINAIICDAPARAFICGIKNHSGYFGCGKCIQEGNFLENRVVFPEVSATLRTDQSFKNRSQPEHHISLSDLEKLNIGMVSQVPLDYMHLICLGVMKRLLIFWVRGRMDVRIKKTLLPLVINRCSSVKRTVTKEFSRSARSVLEVDRWKATEFRQFILYSGIFILKDILPRPFYEHFLSISIAIRILADEEYHTSMFDYASELLNYFVKKIWKFIWK
ncbi:uncharacterized protein [Leptinotarsa decemlineata]|uniref:uncharacterized protein n=1 Tax=Leptinotarsa decemlineata TaxID=7539 RepID=UPI003D304ADE